MANPLPDAYSEGNVVQRYQWKHWISVVFIIELVAWRCSVNNVFLKISQIHKKTPVSESPFYQSCSHEVESAGLFKYVWLFSKHQALKA